MAKKVTVDSSIFVAGIVESESHYRDAELILKQIFDGHLFVIIPTTMLPEVTGAINRRIKDIQKTNSIKEQLLSLVNIKFIPLDLERAVKASEIAVKTGLRGMDAIIVSIAKEFDSELITFDKEMEEKAKVVLV